MSKTSVLRFLVSPEMYAAAKVAMARKRRDNMSEFLREDCLRPVLQEMDLWPPTPGAEEPSPLVDSGVEVAE